jgi:beta-aspartyl-peptidase (threonine type)
VEDNPDDHSVGFGGFPNFDGVVELDASIMDGSTRAAGAVAGLRRSRYAVTVARAVMERSPHVLVVGAGADRLAELIGLDAEELLTPEAERVWREGLAGELPNRLEGEMLDRVRALAADPELAAASREKGVAGTVNFLAIDGAGRLASAVSTSGWAWKFPGRAGDSPIIGAGNYCDSRFGAVACTGHGELAVRASTARMVVAGLEAGRPLIDACAAAVHDLAALGGEPVIMSLVAIDADGGHVAVSSWRDATYVFRTDGMSEYEQIARVHVDVESR